MKRFDIVTYSAESTDPRTNTGFIGVVDEVSDKSAYVHWFSSKGKDNTKDEDYAWVEFSNLIIKGNLFPVLNGISGVVVTPAPKKEPRQKNVVKESKADVTTVEEPVDEPKTETVTVPQGLVADMTKPAAPAANHTFVGKCMLATGKLEHFTRESIIRSIKSQGAIYSTSGVSSKIDILVVGSKPGPNKIAKARELGITMISEDEYIANAYLPFSAVV